MRMRIASMLLAAALGVTLTSAPVGGQPATVTATGPVTVVVQPGPAPAAVAPTTPQTVVAQPGQAVVLQPGQTIALYVQPAAPGSIATAGTQVGVDPYDTDLHRLQLPRSFQDESRTPSER